MLLAGKPISDKVSSVGIEPLGLTSSIYRLLTISICGEIPVVPRSEDHVRARFVIIANNVLSGGETIFLAGELHVIVARIGEPPKKKNSHPATHSTRLGPGAGSRTRPSLFLFPPARQPASDAASDAASVVDVVRAWLREISQRR